MIANSIITDLRISHPAFRVAVYLMSRPNHWQINNTDIQKQLGIGKRETVAKYWKELISAGIVSRRRKPRGARGVFAGFDYCIGPVPDDWKPKAGEFEDFNHAPLSGAPLDGTHSNTDNSNTNFQTSLHDDFSQTGKSRKEDFFTGEAPQTPITSDGAKTTTKKPRRAIFANEIDAEHFPYSRAALFALEQEVKNDPDNNIWTETKTNRPMVKMAHLVKIENNLATLAGCGYVANEVTPDLLDILAETVIALYNQRGLFRSRKKPVDLSFLAGIGMPHYYTKAEMTPAEYTEWAIDAEQGY